MSERNDTPSEIQKIGEEYSWLAEETDESFEGMREYVIVPQIAIVQGQSEPALKDDLGEGAAFLRQGSLPIAGPGEPFLAVPIFFFTEFGKISDRKDTKSPMFLESSFDKTGELAALCRNKATREESYGEDGEYTAKNQEILNFACILYGETEQAGTPFILSYRSGSFFTGQQLVTAAQMRKLRISPEKVVPLPLWSQVWEFHTARTTRDGNTWWVFEHGIPQMPGGAIIRPGERNFFEEKFQDARKSFKEKAFRVQYEEKADVDPVDVDVETSEC